MRRLIRRTVGVLSVLLVLSAALTAVVAWSQGYRVFAVASGSMTPTLAVGGAVVTAPATGLFYEGDIITFTAPPTADQDVMTHRVTAVTDGTLQTWGDANESPDLAPVDHTEVVGKVIWSAPLVGFVLVFFQQPAGLAAVLTLVLCTSLLWDIFGMSSPDRVRAQGPEQPRHLATA